MLKKLLALTLALCMILAMTGCDMFTSGNETNPPADSDSLAAGVQITDGYTLPDPEGLDFDERVAMYADKNSEMVQFLAPQIGATPEVIFNIIYGKDGVPVYYCECMAFSSEEDVQKYTATMEAMGMELTVDGLTATYKKNAEEIEAEITMFKSMSVPVENTMESYVAMYQEMNGMAIVE